MATSLHDICRERATGMSQELSKWSVTSSMTSYSGLLPHVHAKCSSSNEIDFSHQYNKSQNSRSDLSPKRWHCFDRNAPPGNFLLSCAAKRMDVVPYQGVMVWVPRTRKVLELKKSSQVHTLGDWGLLCWFSFKRQFRQVSRQRVFFSDESARDNSGTWQLMPSTDLDMKYLLCPQHPGSNQWHENTVYDYVLG